MSDSSRVLSLGYCQILLEWHYEPSKPSLGLGLRHIQEATEPVYLAGALRGQIPFQRKDIKMMTAMKPPPRHALLAVDDTNESTSTTTPPRTSVETLGNKDDSPLKKKAKTTRYPR